MLSKKTANKKTPPGVSIRHKESPTGGQVWFLDKSINGRLLRGSSKIYRRDCLNDSQWWAANQEWYSYTLEQARRVAIYGERPRRTFFQASEQYLRDNRGRLKDLKNLVRLFGAVNEYVGSVYLHELSSDHTSIKALISSLERRGRKNKTINSYLEVVNRTLRYASNKRDDAGVTWLQNPPKIQLYTLEDQRPPQILPWSKQSLLFGNLPSHLALMSKFILLTGLRDSEICQLNGEDLANMTTHSCLVIQRAKNGQKMPIALSQEAKHVLGAAIGSYCLSNWNKSNSFPVFSYKGLPITRMNNTGWQKTVKRLNLDLTVHDLRHTFGHRLMEAGCPHEVRQVMLGHKAGGVTNHYSQASIETMVRYAELISKPQEDSTPWLSV